MRRAMLLISIAACGDQATPPPLVEVALIPATPSQNLDLLFVLDDSVSTLHLQFSLRAAFPALRDEIASANVHIGVVTSDVGTLGYDDPAPGDPVGTGDGSCSGDGQAGRLQGGFITNSDSDAFAQITMVGSKGCGFEQPLEAMRLALDGRNAGFMRDDARLGVISLQDEDDCSFAHSTLLGSDPSLGPLTSFRCTRFGVECDDDIGTLGPKTNCHSNERSEYVAPIARYRDFLATVKPDPRDVLFAAIAGPAAPVAVESVPAPGGGTTIPALAHACTWQNENGLAVADPAVRMHELTGSLRRGIFESVCSADLSPQLRAIGRQLRTMLGDMCLPSPLVGECRFFDESPSATRELQPCSTGTPDCYQLVEDASCGGGARLQVTRSTAPPADTMTSVRCAVATPAP